MKRRYVPSVVGVLLICGATSYTSAAEHVFKLYNNVSATMTHFSVRGGTVEGFKPTRPGKTLTVKVTLPNGQCVAPVQVRFGSGVGDARADICDKEGYVVTPASTSSGLRLVKRSQVILPK